MSENSVLSLLLTKAKTLHLEHLSVEASPEEVAHSVCAFLNTSGGTVLVEAGADAETAKQRKAKIEVELRSEIIPPALWSVVMEDAGGMHYCIVDVPAGRDRPYMVKSTIYVRRKAKTLAADSDAIREIVEGNFAGSERWERKLMLGVSVERLDENLIRATADDAQKRRNFPFTDATKIESILADLALYRQHWITQAAEVLFGRRPALQFPQIRVRATIYASDKGGDFIDNRQFEAAAIPMLEDVFAMIRQHTPVASTFPGGLQRSDRAAYPEAAVREGLVNAFAHREYANFSGGIAVDMYPERLVIWNSGSLPKGIKIGDLKREHPSMPRNPDIAQIFFLRGLMERVGRGTQKIMTECKDAGLPAPEWKADEAGVTLTFHSKGKSTSARLNLRQRKLLDDLKSDVVIRLPEYCERFAVSERQARRDLGNLVQSGWFEREGDGPTTVFRRKDKEWNQDKPGHSRS